MDFIEAIVDRRIREARAAGLFDNLTGRGKPIPDIDSERPPGWFAARLVKQERDLLRAEGRIPTDWFRHLVRNTFGPWDGHQ